MRYGYQRAGMTTTEGGPSHPVMRSHPQRVVELIEEAVRAARA
ncbi:hypothetical protein ACF1GS_23805 [Streptomyces eurythermus]